MDSGRTGNPIMTFFAYEHLPMNLQAVSRPVGELAREMERTLPASAETSAGLRKLLEAKDCFVRAALSAPKPAAEDGHSLLGISLQNKD